MWKGLAWHVCLQMRQIFQKSQIQPRALPQILLHVLLPATALGACKLQQTAVPSTSQVCALLPALWPMSVPFQPLAHAAAARQLCTAVKIVKIRWISALTG